MKARGAEYNIQGKQGKRFLGMRMRQSFQISEEPGENTETELSARRVSEVT